jgi:LmbE family N-acetylglucosaminyl deacetylase
MSGQPVTILSVTDGEAADPSRAGLDLIRREELRNALKKLSLIHVEVERLGLPDGKVNEHRNRLHNAIASLLGPTTTLVAPHEQDGHPDHEAVGRTCIEISQAHRVVLARYPIWLWHHTEPRALGAAHWGRFPLSADAQRAKARAIQCFGSQLRPPHGNPVVPAHVLEYFSRPYEAFVLADGATTLRKRVRR